MSSFIEAIYELEANRKKEMYLARIRETTSVYAAKYRSLLDDLADQGLDKYIRKDFDSAVGALNRIEKLLKTDPETARRESFSLGSWIGGLPGLARSIYRELEERKEAERKAVRKEYRDFLQSILSELKDPVIRDFAYREYREIINQYKNDEVTRENLEKIKDEISNQLAKVMKAAEKKASEWKLKKKNKSGEESKTAAIRIQKEVVQECSAKHDPEKFKEILSKLSSLESTVRNHTEQDLTEELSQITRDSDEIILDEEYRRETVKAVVNALKQSGFIVERPYLDPKDKTGGEVIIKAQTLAKQESIFQINRDGGMKYKFHKYKGNACKKDIEKVLPKIQEIYGIKLSKERVIWENPDQEDITHAATDQSMEK